MTLLFPPSAYDLLISTASLLCHGELYLHRCCMSEEQTRLQRVCRCRTLKDVASGASSVTFSHPPHLHHPPDVCGSGLNPGHGREVWCHERHIGRCEEGWRSKRGGEERGDEGGDRWVCSRGRRNKRTTIKFNTSITAFVNLLDNFSEHLSDF